MDVVRVSVACATPPGTPEPTFRSLEPAGAWTVDAPAFQGTNSYQHTEGIGPTLRSGVCIAVHTLKFDVFLTIPRKG